MGHRPTIPAKQTDAIRRTADATIIVRIQRDGRDAGGWAVRGTEDQIDLLVGAIEVAVSADGLPLWKVEAQENGATKK